MVVVVLDHKGVVHVYQYHIFLLHLNIRHSFSSVVIPFFILDRLLVRLEYI